MLLCECGNLFNENEAQTDVFGFKECPICHGQNHEEVFECDWCGEWREDLDMASGICVDCIHQEAKRISTAVEYGRDRTSFVEINGLYGYLFDKDEIDSVLHEHLKAIMRDNKRVQKKRTYSSASSFCTDDISDFAEWLKDNK